MVAVPRTVMVVTAATVKFADTQAALTAATEYQCVVTAAALVASPNTLEVPATGCAPASQTASGSSWALELSWLQDWTTAAGGGLSFYAFNQDAKVKWFSISPSSPEGPPVATGQCTVVAGPYLGEFGTTLLASASFPVQGKPAITAPTVELAATEAEQAETGEPVDAVVG